MRYLKLNEGTTWMSEKKIDEICDEFGIFDYVINPDRSIDVDGDVDITCMEMKKIPIRFRKVSGSFDCSDNQLTTLKGCPSEVGFNFECHTNKLTSLEGCPDRIDGSFDCSYNKLVTLKFGPVYVGGNFNCYNNKLTTLEGGPREVGGYFNCDNNKLTSLVGCPDELDRLLCMGNELRSLEGAPTKYNTIYYDDNPIFNIRNLFRDDKSFMDSLDYGYLRGNGIVKTRFKEACEEADIRMPYRIKKWNWI